MAKAEIEKKTAAAFEAIGTESSLERFQEICIEARKRGDSPPHGSLASRIKSLCDADGIRSSLLRLIGEQASPQRHKTAADVLGRAAVAIVLGNEAQEAAWVDFAAKQGFVRWAELMLFAEYGVKPHRSLLESTLREMARLSVNATNDYGSRRAFKNLASLLRERIYPDTDKRARTCLDFAVKAKATGTEEIDLKTVVALILNLSINRPAAPKLRAKVDDYLRTLAAEDDIPALSREIFGDEPTVLETFANDLTKSPEGGTLGQEDRGPGGLDQGTPEEQEKPEQRPAFLEAILVPKEIVASELPYEKRVAKLITAKKAFDRQYADACLSVLKEEMQNPKRKHHTIEEKRSFVEWVNSEAKRMGLVFKNPKVDRRATLVVDPGHAPELGRFQLRTEAEISGTGKDETLSTSHLHKLLNNLLLMTPMAREKRRGLADDDSIPHRQ